MQSSASRQGVTGATYELVTGASLSLIGSATGLGRGSLYHFFPGGKQEMAAAVLADVAGWFDAAIFTPLEQADDPRAGIDAMMVEVDRYFASGQRALILVSTGTP